MLAVGLPKWPCKAVQRSRLPASTAPCTPLRSKFNDLSCPLPWSLHAFMVLHLQGRRETAECHDNLGRHGFRCGTRPAGLAGPNHCKPPSSLPPQSPLAAGGQRAKAGGNKFRAET